MLTRRVFIGSTLGGIGFIQGTLPAEEHNPDYVPSSQSGVPGFLKSFKWEFAEVEYGPVAFNPYRRYVSFPLDDHLIVKYMCKVNNNTNDAIQITEDWVVNNWQLKGFAFDIIDFLHLPKNCILSKPGESWDVHKLYKGMKFKLCSVGYCGCLEFETQHPDSYFLSPPYNYEALNKENSNY